MEVMPSDKVTLSSISQFLKAPMPIVFTLPGIVISLRPRASLNASSPIDVTVSGIVISLRPRASLNASSPIDVTVSGISTL